MPTQTTRLGLEKPDPTENVDIAVINQNMDDIDAAFGGIVAAYRNVIRNGDFSVAQRGSSFANPAFGYTLDGWLHGSSGGTTRSVFRDIASTVSMGEDDTSGYVLTLQTVGQSAVGDYFHISAVIENVRTFAGKQVTLSFDARATTGTPKIAVEVEQNFGTGGSPSATVQTAISAVTISTTKTRYSVTFTIPSVAGKTLGSNGNDALAIRLWTSAGTTFAARASNIGIQNTVIYITDVQLEKGSVATAFERLPQQVQLAWCQRYYWRGVGDFVSVQAMEANAAAVDIIFPVTMRATPVLGNSALPHVFSIPFYGGSTTATTSIAPQYSSARRGLWVYSQAAWGLTGGRWLILNGPTSYLDATAEL